MPFNFAPAADSAVEDKGITVRYRTMDDTEFVTLRSVLTDAILEAATEQSATKTKGRDGEFKRALIQGMVLGGNIVDAATGQGVLLTPEVIRSLSPQLKNWLIDEINKCDGSTAGLAQVEIAGRSVTFRQAA